MNIEQPTETTTCWVQLYSDSLYSWALYKTSNKETAEDLVQETFLVAVKSIEKFKGESNPKTWLFGILNNKINHYYRSRYRDPIVKEDIFLNAFFDESRHWRAEEAPHTWSEEQGNLFDDPDFHLQWQNCLGRLPSHWHSAIQLKFMNEKNSADICQELGLSDTNFWQILHRAKLQLRKCLELNWFKK